MVDGRMERINKSGEVKDEKQDSYDASRRALIKGVGASAILAGVELLRGRDFSAQEKREIPGIFLTILKGNEAKSFLETPLYRDAKTPEALDVLYERINPNDQDISDEIAGAISFTAFLEQNPKEKRIAQYRQEEVAKIYQQAGNLTYKAFENYISAGLKRQDLDSQDLATAYIAGFQKAHTFFETSLDLTGDVSQKEAQIVFNNLREMTKSLGVLANTAMLFGNKKDKISAAHLRKIATENVKLFKKLEGKTDIVSLGEGKFLFFKVSKIIDAFKDQLYSVYGNEAEKIIDGWKRSGYGGITLNTIEFQRDLNMTRLMRGSLPSQEERIAKLLLLTFHK